MAQSYTRQSTFSDGDTISASLFNNEYNQLLNAFSYSAGSSSSTGHRHDGTAGQGGNIFKIGDLDFLNKIEVDGTNNRLGFYVEVSSAAVEQIRIQDGAIVPVTDNDIDLGTSSLEFKDLYIDGTANLDSLVLGSGSTVTAILDEDDLSSDSATSLATQQSIKAYVDAQVTAQDFDFSADSGGSLSIDLDSEAMTFTGGTGIDTSGSGNAVTFAIDSTVATLTGSQTLTNKTLTAPTLTGTAVVASLDISGDVDVDGTLETDALSINGTIVTSTAAELNILDGVTSTAAELNILDGVTSTTAELNILDGVTATTAELNIMDGVTSTAAELNILDGKAFLDEDDMSSDSATGIASQQSIKAYVDAQITAEDLDFQADSGGALSIDLDSETFTFTGGTGIDTSGSGNAVTFAIDSTVATLTGTQTLTNKTLTSPTLNTPTIGTSFTIGSATITEAELEILDGATVTTAELNILDGVTSTAAELNILDGVTSTAAELNILDGVTSTAAELNILDGVTSTAAELNILDGVTSTATELNIIDGSTSATSTTLADADRVVVNDNGTMVQVALTDFETYFESALDTLSNVTTVGTLGSLTVSGDVTVDTNTLKVDSSNNRVGINQASPTVSLDLGSNTDALLVPVGTTAQRPSGAAGQFRYNSTLGRFEGHNGTEFAEIGGGGGTNTFTRNSFSGDGSTTAFTLSQSIDDENDLIVFNGGVFQNQAAYSVSGTTLTFGTAPANGNTLIVYSVRTAVSGSNTSIATMTGDGSDTTLTLSANPVNENNVQVYIDGVYQNKSTFSISGTTLTFSTAPPNGSAVEAITLTQTDINTATILKDADEDTKIQVEESSDEDKIRFDTAGTERFQIDSSGNAIFTKSGGAYLQLKDASAVRGAINVGTSDGLVFTTGSSFTERMRISSAGSLQIPNQNAINEIEFTGTEYTNIYSATTGGMDVGTTGSGYLRLLTNNAERLRIDSSGNVGIGISSPSSTLDISAPANTTPLEINAATDGSNYSSIRNAAGTDVGYFGLGTALLSGAAATDFVLRAQAGNLILMSGGNHEAARFDTSRNFLVGRTSAGATGNGHSIRGGDSAIFSRDSSGESMIVARNASAGDLVRFYCNGSDRGSIDFDGSNTISYTSSSDQRLKENIADADDAGSKIDAIQVRKFDWIADGSHQDYGMIAQELQTVAPEAVGGDPDSDKMMGVDYSKLVPMLVKEIQSLRARVTQLENN